MHDVLYTVPKDQIDILQDKLSGTIVDLKGLWSGRLSPLQEGVLEELERIEFRLIHRDKVRPRNDSAGEKPYFICRKCETAILIVDISDVICPACRTDRGLELVYA